MSSLSESLHRCFAVAVLSRMRALLVVFEQPLIYVRLQLFKRAIDFLAKGDVVKLVLHGLMKALADAVGLRRPKDLTTFLPCNALSLVSPSVPPCLHINATYMLF